MKNSMRVVWLIVLGFFLSGCSGYQYARFPGHPAKADEFSEESQIETGSLVRATMISGEIHEGTLTEVGTDYIEILYSDPAGDIHHFSSQEVLKLEQYKEASPLEHLGAATALVVGGVGLYLILNDDSGSISPDTGAK